MSISALVTIILSVLSLAAVLPLQAASVGKMLTEYLENPLGIDSAQPCFTWQMVSEKRNTRQTAYQIQVASNEKLLKSGKPDMWNSGKVVSAQSAHVQYAGKPLKSRTAYFWRVRVWDENGKTSQYSKPAYFETALLQQSEWQGEWISAPIPTVFTGRNGYHSEFMSDANAQSWVQVDFGHTSTFDTVVLFPARPFNWKNDDPGFGFPVRYKLEVSDTPDFSNPRIIADYTDADQPNPGKEPVRVAVGEHSARCVRLTATRLHHPEDAQSPLLALAEIEVLNHRGENIAKDSSVTASTSIENHGWSKAYLTDGKQESFGPSGNTDPASPLLRHEFVIEKPVARARAYVTGLGYYEFYLNGKKVGDRVLDPPYTTFSKRVYYSSYDVTGMLRQGLNCAAAMLGQGWWRDAPRFLLQMEVFFSDGTSVQIVTNRNWRWTFGPVLSNSLYHGETYDARKELPDWNKPGFNDSSWPAVEPSPMPETVLSAEMIQPVKVVQTLNPVKRTNPKPGVWVFDFGQNFSGWCKIRLSGSEGTTIRLRHAELLYPDGTVNQENLRSAKATETYILSGKEEQVFEPRFTYHGFRYVQVEGMQSEPALDSIQGQVVHTAFEQTGTFECSNSLLNQVQRNAQWTIRTNFHSIPTDCPQRDERQGWMCDAYIAACAAMYSFNIPPAYRKFLADIKDAQGADGSIPDTVPHVWGTSPGDPWWSIAYHGILWEMYLHTGDRTLLEQHYDGARSYLELLRRECPEYIMTRSNYGEWVAVVPTPTDLVSTSAFYWTSKLVADFAEILGKKEDALTYRKLCRQIASAFNARFYSHETGIYGNGSQASFALPLYMGIVPSSRRKAVTDALCRNIMDERKGHLSTGLVASLFLMDFLAETGHADIACSIATKEDYPGWGYMVKNGATTVWELWQLETGPGMNSHNHPWAGFISGWYFKALAGIQPDLRSPGWEHFRVKPNVVNDLTWAKASVGTVKGHTEVRWMKTSDGLVLMVTVPANCTATVHVPKLGKTQPIVSEGDKTIWTGGRFYTSAEGVLSGKDAGESLEFVIGSGSYLFTLR